VRHGFAVTDRRDGCVLCSNEWATGDLVARDYLVNRMLAVAYLFPDAAVEQVLYGFGSIRARDACALFD